MRRVIVFQKMDGRVFASFTITTTTVLHIHFTAWIHAKSDFLCDVLCENAIVIRLGTFTMAFLYGT